MAEQDELALSDAEGEQLQDEAQAELAAIDAASAEAASAEAGDGEPGADDELARLRAELDEARGGLEAERLARHDAVARYREAVLAAEPALPPELVGGESLEEVDASVEAARRAVAQIREQLAQESEEEAARGFPAGAPGRLGPGTGAMSASEKIAFGLERRPGG